MSMRVTVNTLTYNSKVVGYRLYVTDTTATSKYYDLNVEVAEKYGIAKGVTGIEVPLIDYNGVLMSRKEKENGIAVEDMSTNVAFIRELCSLNSTKSRTKDIKQKVEEDKKRAKQMDMFERLFRVCLNAIYGNSRVVRILNYNVFPINLEKEIDKVLVSQGVFTTNKKLNIKLKVEIVNYLRGSKYLYIDVKNYKSSDDTKNTAIDEVVRRCSDSVDLIIKL